MKMKFLFAAALAAGLTVLAEKAPADPLLEQVVTRAFDLIKAREARVVKPLPTATPVVVAPKNAEDLAPALRAALEKIQRGESPSKALVLAPGKYVLNETIEIAGEAFTGLSIGAAKGTGPVEIAGGRTFPLTAFTRPSAAQLARFPAAVRDKVVCLKLNIPDALTRYGFGENTNCGVMLFADDGAQHLEPARWPKGLNYPPVRFAGDKTFRFVDPSAPKVAAGAMFLMHGYWKFFWADAALPVKSLGDGSFELTRKPAYQGVGSRPIAAMIGVPEAMTEPGEWCYADGILYVYPKLGMKSVTVPQARGPFFRIRNAAQVCLHDLMFTDTVGGALAVTNAVDFQLAECKFLRLGGDAARVQACPRATIVDCTFADLGHTALKLSAGDRRTLTAGDTLVANCSFRATGRLQRTYTPGILLEGCGNTVRNCSFTDLPSSGMRLEGNDHLVRDCSFVRTILESDDQGSTDMWYDPTYRGCVFFKNEFRDAGGAGGKNGCGRAGIRFDDMISGMAVISNTFIRTAEGHFGGVQMNGGHYNAVVGNKFDASRKDVTINNWGAARWRSAYSRPEIREKCKVAENNPDFIKRYPEYGRRQEDPCRELIRDNEHIDVK